MDFSHVKSYIFKNVYTGLIKTVISLLLSFITVPLIIKNIGIERFGIISMVLLFSGFTGVFDLGLSNALVLFQQDRVKYKKEISAIYIFNLIIFVLVLLSVGLIYLFDISIMGNKLNVSPDMLQMIGLISILILALSIPTGLFIAILEGHFKLQYVNWGFTIQSVVIYMGWFLLSIYNVGIVYYLFVPLIGSILVILFYASVLPPIRSTFVRPDWESSKNALQTAFRFLKLGLLNSIHLPMTKYLIVLLTGDGRAIGVFELSSKLALLVNNVLAHVSKPFFSLSSQLKHDKERLTDMVTKTTLILCTISIVGYFLFLFMEKYIILYFFKEYRSDIVFVLHSLLISCLLLASSEVIQNFLIGTGKIHWVIYIKFIGFVFNLLLLFLFYITHSLRLESMTLSYSLNLSLIGLFWLFYLWKERRKTARDR